MPKVTGIPEVRFNLNVLQDRNKPTLILAVFRYRNRSGSHRLLYSTRLKIEPKNWQAKSYRPRPNFVLYDHHHTELQRIAKGIRDLYVEYSENAPDPEDFRKEMDYRLGREDRPIDDQKTPELLAFAFAYCDQRKEAQDANRGTWKKLYTVANHLQAFADEERSGVLTYADIDWNWRDDFLNWLYKAPRSHSINNASKIVAITKQFMNEARRRGFHDNLIFQEREFGVTRKKIKHITLDFDRLRKLYEMDLSENSRLERVRDLFIIGAYSGLRISDFKRIRPEHIVGDGEYEMIHINTQKTKTDVYVPLFPELKETLAKYDYNSPPAISDQKMNDYLKELCQLADFDDDVMHTVSEGGRMIEKASPRWSLVTSHTARRSFATNFYELGIPAAELMAITGHSTEKQFFGYINVDKKKLAQNMAARAFRLLKRT